MADKIQFQTNVPESVALKYANGKRVESRYNDYEVYYSLADGRALYATPALDAKITALGPAAGEVFTMQGRNPRRQPEADRVAGNSVRDAGSAPGARGGRRACTRRCYIPPGIRRGSCGRF
jgi:hypothetical protein